MTKAFEQLRAVTHHAFDEAAKDAAEERRAKIEMIASETTADLFQRMYQVIGANSPPIEVTQPGGSWKPLTKKWRYYKQNRHLRYNNGPGFRSSEDNSFYWGISPKRKSLRGFLENKRAQASFGRPKATLRKTDRGYEVVTDLYPRLKSLKREDIFSRLRGREKMVVRLAANEKRRPFLQPFLIYTMTVRFQQKLKAKL